MYKFLIYSLIVSVVALLGCEKIQEITVSEEVQTLKIGFIVAGDRAPYLNGAQLAVDEINELGGILGTPIELVSPY